MDFIFTFSLHCETFFISKDFGVVYISIGTTQQWEHGNKQVPNTAFISMETY